MIANKFFYIKRERKKKKKLILKCIWPILSKNSYKLKHECFFSTLEGRFLKLQFVTPKLASFQNFQSSTGTKTRLVLGSGQPRQRVMKTFPSFFFLFFFLHRNDNYKRSSCVQRGAASCHDRNVVSLSLCFFSRLHHECNLSSNAFPSGQQQLCAPYVSTYNADWQRAPHKITSVEENTDHMDGC